MSPVACRRGLLEPSNGFRALAQLRIHYRSSAAVQEGEPAGTAAALGGRSLARTSGIAGDLCKGRTVVAMNGDKEPFGVEAIHLRRAVRRPGQRHNDDEDEVVVAVDFRSLVELLRVFGRERMELEDLAQDVEVVSSRVAEIEPEEAAASEQALACLAVEGDDFAALIVGDLAS